MNGCENFSCLNDLNRHDNIIGLTDLNSQKKKKKSKATCLWLLGDFLAIRKLNDLNSLNDFSGLNGFILSKRLLNMMLPLTWQQNDLSWSLTVEWIINNPKIYGFLALFLLEAVEAKDVTFHQSQVL